MISPFAPVNLPLLEKSQILDDNDPNLLLDPKVIKRPYKKKDAQPEPLPPSDPDTYNAIEDAQKSIKKQKVTQNPEPRSDNNHD